MHAAELGIDAPVPNTDFFLDSGAPTLYNRLIRRKSDKSQYIGAYFKDRKRDDFSFLQTQEYLDYRDAYIAFIKEHVHMLTLYVNLDVINNPAETYKNQRYLEDHGLDPIPVFHVGCDEKWLRTYIDEGYEYLALGGMTPNPINVVVPILDRIWSEILCDKDGMPKLKVHGLAETSIAIMVRYPWYSVDSASWLKYGIYGLAIFPRRFHGVYRYDRSPDKIAVSTRAVGLVEQGKHFKTLPRVWRERFLAYIKERGYRFGKSHFKIESEDYLLKDDELDAHVLPDDPSKRKVEVIEEWGISNNLDLRTCFNGEFYLEMEKAIPEWPWSFHARRQVGRLL